MTGEVGEPISELGITSEARLDMLRNEINIQLGICMAQLEIATTFLFVRHDQEAIKTLGDARDRMRAVLAQAAKLDQALKDTGINGDAATEWRSQAYSRRRA